MNEIVYFVAGGVALLAVGIGLGYWIARLRVGKRAAEDVQKQFDDYRQDVSEHFGRTAEHFQAIGQQYRELYEHMASGADALIDQQALDEKLSFVPAGMIESRAEEAIKVNDSAPAPRDYADDDESSDMDGSVDEKDSAVEPADLDKAQAADEDGSTEPATDEPAEDVPQKAKTDDGDDAPRIYH